MPQRTLDDLKAQGYTFSNYGDCRYCGSPLEWWKSLTGNSVPYDPMPRGSSPAVPHRQTCSDPPERP